MEDFLNKNNKIAVVGVSTNTEKWGYKVYNALLEEGYRVFPVNPKYEKIGDKKCYPNLHELPDKPDVVITVVPPKVTDKVVEECKELGIKKVWMQPGSESDEAIEFCEKNDIKVMYNACFVVNGLKKSW